MRDIHCKFPKKKIRKKGKYRAAMDILPFREIKDKFQDEYCEIWVK